MKIISRTAVPRVNLPHTTVGQILRKQFCFEMRRSTTRHEECAMAGASSSEAKEAIVNWEIFCWWPLSLKPYQSQGLATFLTLFLFLFLSLSSSKSSEPKPSTPQRSSISSDGALSPPLSSTLHSPTPTSSAPFAAPVTSMRSRPCLVP